MEAHLVVEKSLVVEGQLVVELAQGGDSERDAAGVWARATAQRDHMASVAPAEEKLPGIREALAVEGASLHLARCAQRVVGFCVLVPQPDVLEIRYLATDPEVWGAGAGRALLAHVHEHARQSGFSRGELWVISDNVRAISAYEGAGWVATDTVEERGSVGRVERRFVRDFL